MTLGEKQRLFVKLVGQLITWSYAHGYELTFGETVRTSAQAAANATAGKGISRSLHLVRLAVDLNLFVNGEYRTGSADYQALGEYWESLNPLCCWGGRFARPDGNHFSITHEGVR